MACIKATSVSLEGRMDEVIERFQVDIGMNGPMPGATGPMRVSWQVGYMQSTLFYLT